MKPVDHRALVEGAVDVRPSLAEFQALVDAIPQMAWGHFPGDPPREVYNPLWMEFTGLALAPDGSTRRSLIHEEDRERAMHAWRQALESGTAYEAEYRLQHRSGDHRWIRSRGAPQRGPGGEIFCWIGTCSDVDDLVRARAALTASEALNRSVLAASADSIKLLSPEGIILFMNEAAGAALAEHGFAAPLGRDWLSTLPSVSRYLADAALAAVRAGEVARFTSLRYSEGGSPEWRDFVLSPVAAADGSLDGIVVSARDVTPERLAHEQLRWASTHDALTRLPNRNFFMECLHEALRQAARDGSSLALLVIDIADLGQVNDALGYSAGDELLSSIAERLRTCAGDRNVVGRLGGDQFGLILEGVAGEDGIAPTAEALHRTLSAPFALEGKLVDARTRIGASLYPRPGNHAADLMKQAHIALDAAKQASRSDCVLFEPAMRAGLQNRLSMLALTRDALRDGRIEPFYQPKVDLRTGLVSGFEALFRWRDPRGRIHNPGTVFAAFEDPDLAPQITARIVGRVVADVRGWLDAGLAFGHVAINAAGADFRTGDLAGTLLEQLRAASIPPHAIQLEVTETVFLGRGAGSVESALRRLDEAGIKVALDDFGTGYASLTHLKTFPVSVLKLDQSFIRDLGADAGSEAIVRGIIELSRSLGLATVAEGVETVEQEQFLRSCGCDHVQGFLYWRAVEASKVARVLRWSSGRPLRRRTSKPQLKVVSEGKAR